MQETGRRPAPVNTTIARDPYLNPEPAHDQNYLGQSNGTSSHFRDQSVDVSDDQTAYPAMQRVNSSSPLHPAESYFTRPDQTSPPTTSRPNTPGGTRRVHYPPRQYIETSAPAAQYTTVPLKDSTANETTNMATSGRGTPYSSGHTTPNGSSSRRRGWNMFSHSSTSLEAGQMGEKRPKHTRNGSWDLLNNNPEWEGYNPATAKNENLRFAEGDVGTTKFSRLYYWLINKSIIIRWILYIVPVLAILWIPGIVGLTAAPNGKVWDVKLIWWSIWLSVLWGGFWAATAVFMMIPPIWRNVIGSIVPSAKQYTDVTAALGRYAKLIVWAAAVWISFTPLVIIHNTAESTNNETPRSKSDLGTMVNILFGLFLSSIILGVEKLIVQLIAFQFHRDSYEDRLKEQKFNIKCLATLYIHSHDIPGRSDTLRDNDSHKTKASQVPKKAIRAALRGIREVAQTTTTALGNVASEMAGQSVLQTNSPQNKVTAALSSANKSKALARRLFYSFRRGDADHLDLSDIARFFPDLDTAKAGFEMFDVDGNGDATRDEMEAAIMQIHRERLSLEASMRDLDGAVRRLDDIFLFFVALICALILAATITTKITTLVTSAGTFVLGLSWLIGSTMQEILLACIFLFVKHPYDVGDRVDIDGNSYTVAKMQLMSTNFKRTDGKFVWIGHNILATKVIENIRRSGPTSETFTFDVAFDTSFDHLTTLRDKMLVFCKENSRDFLPIFDVTVDDMPAQGKMVLKADIRYKSNWQQGALKVMRRNKWVCALKTALAETKIYGPAGAGDPSPAPAEPTKYTLVPYEQVQAAEAAAASTATASTGAESPPPTFDAATNTANNLTDRRELINDPNIFDESLDMSGQAGYQTRPTTPGVEGSFRAAVTVGPPVGQLRTRVPHGMPGEQIEMVSAPVARR
ncbi:Mechanosensitive ion channel-domain-containing protein [Kockovaella imperatae]|uniref:Mechanosensitive ion channel protein n=1 Tax=Kockovaella imperatae TaxID=4999 RepID=A0A1Y1UDI7_9TREE|nr:Mechanosensitive ion channel-domain-containing protein [Kockovaella imperatae]ORX36049.1 Mechanosensitive ion channel-domain-containing protein [Kockovaella imperatae]